MALFALCINPLLHYLDTHLEGIRFGPTANGVAVVAYADDVPIFVTQRDEFRIIQDTLQRYEQATGARLNIQKSKALAIGWNDTGNDLGVDFVQKMRLLGIIFSATIEGTAHNSWSRTATQIRSQAQQAYGRILSIVQRIQYKNNTLLAPIWHIAQTLPPPETHSTTNDRSTMVPTALSHLPSAPVNKTKTLEARSLGFTRHSCKMSNSTLRAYVASKPKRGIRDR